MNKILKRIVIIFIITALVFVAGCSDEGEEQEPVKDDATVQVTPTEDNIPLTTPASDPKLRISPDTKFPKMEPNGRYSENITIGSTHDDAYGVALYAYPGDGHLGVYLDGKEEGPFEAEKMLKGSGQVVNLSIQSSPNTPDGDYIIYLDSTYHDINNNSYEASTNITVTVENKGWTLPGK